MPLSDSDWSEVLDHTRRRVREAGLEDVDRRVTLDFRPSKNPSADFLRYVSSVIAGTTEKSLSGYTRALGALREGLTVEGAQQVQGITVAFNEGETRLYGVERIDLGEAQDLRPLILELEKLREYLTRNGVQGE